MNVFDFDNTIYDGESCFDLFLFYIRRDPGLLRLLPEVLRAFAKYKRGLVTAEAFLHEYASLAEEKLRQIPDIEGDMRLFWDRHMRKIKPFYAALRQADDVIVTAAPDFSMREVCRRLGVRHCLATRVDPETCEILHFNLRERKIESFRAAYPDGRIDKFYTDSPKNDAPLIAMAREAYVVRGRKIRRIK
ncbi:MAG: haloacid dehalogenase-like hydrolase [Clostridia bacterium]|nr:haloacid dehalogenase-like hydrolase [Clostridia bacterium]